MFEHAWLHTAPHIDRLSCLSTRALSDFCLQEISNNSLDSSGASSADVATINAAARSDIKGCSNRQRIQTATKAAKTAKQGPLSSTMTKTAGADKGHNQRQKAASTDKGHKEHNSMAASQPTKPNSVGNTTQTRAPRRSTARTPRSACTTEVLQRLRSGRVRADTAPASHQSTWPLAGA